MLLTSSGAGCEQRGGDVSAYAEMSAEHVLGPEHISGVKVDEGPSFGYLE